MVSNDKSICQNCGSKLKRYDKVSRIVRTKGGKTSWIEIERFRCPVCGQIHREFFAFLLYLLYGKEWLFVLIINGNIKSCEMKIIQSVSSLTASEHIPKGIIPTVENTENIITTSASHNKITA